MRMFPENGGFLFSDKSTGRFDSKNREAMMIGSLKLMYSSLVLAHKCAVKLYLYGNDENVLRQIAEPSTDTKVAENGYLTEDNVNSDLLKLSDFKTTVGSRSI